MFTTPAARSTTARRSLGFRASSTNPQRTANPNDGQSQSMPQEDSESAQQNNDQANSNSNEEVLSMLRSLQQQVSTMQAQQARAASERTARNPASTPNSSLNDRRKLPKELSVS